MKPVLLAKIGLLGGIVLSFILDSTTILGFSLTLATQLMLVYAFFMFAKNYQKKSIFSFYLIAFLITLVINLTFIFAVSSGSKHLMTKFGNSNETDVTAFLEDLANRAKSDPEFASEILKSLMTPQFIGYASVIVIGFVMVLVFSSMAYKNLGKAAGIKNFVLCGNLFLIGGLTLIVGIGLLLILVAFILLIISVFQMNETLVAQGKNHENPLG